MDSRHGIKIKASNGDPISLSLRIDWLAMIDAETKLEVRKGLFESPDDLLDFNVYPHFFLDIAS